MDTESIEFPDEVINADDIDVEEIMAKIRAHIAERRLDDKTTSRSSDVRFEGRFSRTVYEELFAAIRKNNQIEVPLNVTKTEIPVIGPLIDAVRRKLHWLVLFYLNNSAARQAAVNQHLVRSLSALIEDLEQNMITQDEFEYLKEKVEALENSSDNSGK